MQYDTQNKPSKRSFKGVTLVIIVTSRIKRINNSSYYQQFVEQKNLRIQIPIDDSLNQLMTGQLFQIDSLLRKAFQIAFVKQKI
ncbi:unnamed protein product [Paramecium pentaurelia]|uniref:Uncharacterized protein n=1 Tax=Paramecium pentaurelia TaxID=43138 RepID=A0A8S1RX00_9CILI|nr:unnamed protein product [Paramecium pentaurelia]